MVRGADRSRKSQMANLPIDFPSTIQESQDHPGTLAHITDSKPSSRRSRPPFLNPSTHQTGQLQPKPQPMVVKAEKEIASRQDRTSWLNRRIIRTHPIPRGLEMPSRARGRKETKDAMLATGRKLGCEKSRTSKLDRAMCMKTRWRIRCDFS